MTDQYFCSNFELFKSEADEIHWFNEKDTETAINFIKTKLSKNNTKLIATISSKTDKNQIINLITCGVRIFNLKCALFKVEDYSEVIKRITAELEKIKERPTFIFSLQGPIPVISNTYYNDTKRKFIEVKKGQVVKITNKSKPIKDNSYTIVVDKKIYKCAEKNDTIVIDSNVTLKVIFQEDCLYESELKRSTLKSSYCSYNAIRHKIYSENLSNNSCNFLGSNNHFNNLNSNNNINGNINNNNNLATLRMNTVVGNTYYNSVSNNISHINNNMSHKKVLDGNSNFNGSGELLRNSHNQFNNYYDKILDTNKLIDDPIQSIDNRIHGKNNNRNSVTNLYHLSNTNHLPGFSGIHNTISTTQNLNTIKEHKDSYKERSSIATNTNNTNNNNNYMKNFTTYFDEKEDKLSNANTNKSNIHSNSVHSSFNLKKLNEKFSFNNCLNNNIPTGYQEFNLIDYENKLGATENYKLNDDIEKNKKLNKSKDKKDVKDNNNKEIAAIRDKLKDIDIENKIRKSSKDTYSSYTFNKEHKDSIINLAKTNNINITKKEKEDVTNANNNINSIIRKDSRNNEKERETKASRNDNTNLYNTITHMNSSNTRKLSTSPIQNLTTNTNTIQTNTNEIVNNNNNNNILNNNRKNSTTINTNEANLNGVQHFNSTTNFNKTNKDKEAHPKILIDFNQKDTYKSKQVNIINEYQKIIRGPHFMNNENSNNNANANVNNTTKKENADRRNSLINNEEEDINIIKTTISSNNNNKNNEVTASQTNDINNTATSNANTNIKLKTNTDINTNTNNLQIKTEKQSDLEKRRNNLKEKKGNNNRINTKKDTKESPINTISNNTNKAKEFVSDKEIISKISKEPNNNNIKFDINDNKDIPHAQTNFLKEEYKHNYNFPLNNNNNMLACLNNNPNFNNPQVTVHLNNTPHQNINHNYNSTNVNQNNYNHNYYISSNNQNSPLTNNSFNNHYNPTHQLVHSNNYYSSSLKDRQRIICMGYKFVDKISNTNKFFPMKPRTKSPKKVLVCEVESAGECRIQSEVLIVGKDLSNKEDSSTLGAKEITDISRALKLNITIISAYINKASDITEIRKIVDEDSSPFWNIINVDENDDKRNFNNNRLKIFAKILTNQSIINFDEILSEADGIILNPTFISNDINYDDLCLIETYITEKCIIANKPLFIESNCINSLQNNMVPSMSDISNLDSSINAGIDGFILNDNLPKESIVKLQQIISEMENLADSKNKYDDMSKAMRNFNDDNFKSFLSDNKFNVSSMIETLFDSVAKMTFEVPIDMILLFCDSFVIAKRLSKYRPNCRILIPTNNRNEYDFLRLFRGVSGIYTTTQDINCQNEALFQE